MNRRIILNDYVQGTLRLGAATLRSFGVGTTILVLESRVEHYLKLGGATETAGWQPSVYKPLEKASR